MRKKFVVTGTLASGKTTIIKNYRPECYKVEEAARYIIERAQNKNSTLYDSDCVPWKDFHKFQDEVLKLTIDWETTFDNRYPYSLHDRAIPDAIGYYREKGLEPPQRLFELARAANYTEVCLLMPLPFKPDKVRRETPERQLNLHNFIEQAYVDCGYTPLLIPTVSIPTRLDMIEDTINSYLEIETNRNKLEEMLSKHPQHLSISNNHKVA